MGIVHRRVFRYQIEAYTNGVGPASAGLEIGNFYPHLRPVRVNCYMPIIATHWAYLRTETAVAPPALKANLRSTLSTSLAGKMRGLHVRSNVT